MTIAEDFKRRAREGKMPVAIALEDGVHMTDVSVSADSLRHLAEPERLRRFIVDIVRQVAGECKPPVD